MNYKLDHPNYIYIFTDGGRPIRPLLKVKHNKLLYDKTYENKIITKKYK